MCQWIAALIADVPLGHQVLVPGADLGGIRRAGRARLASDTLVTHRQDGIGHQRRRAAQRLLADEAVPDMQQLRVARGIGPALTRFSPTLVPRS